MSEEPAVLVEGLIHRYGAREAVAGVSFAVGRGELFGLLGPNGGGKTTLFRILSTALIPAGGRARVLGLDVVREAAELRRRIGVVFQSPSLDRKLTAAENLWHHGHLYGLSGRALRAEVDAGLSRIGLGDRANDRVEQLSGGQRRRVEVAKGLLTRPQILLMDEPSTGLDPAARRDLWQHLRAAQRQDGLTILVTTHLMEEAERCDRLGIMHRGRLVALDTPAALMGSVDGEVLSLETAEPERLADAIRKNWDMAAVVVDGTVRLERVRAHELIPEIFRAFPREIHSVTARRRSLEDVFIERTGHRLWDDSPADPLARPG